MAATQASPKKSPRKAKADQASSGLKEMLDHASAQRQAEVLATRLALLKQQESRVTGQTEETRMRLQELGAHKEEQARRIAEKEDALREMHAKDAFYANSHKAHAHDKAHQSQNLQAVPEDDALAQLANKSAVAQLAMQQAALHNVAAMSAAGTAVPSSAPAAIQAGSPRVLSQGPTPRMGMSLQQFPYQPATPRASASGAGPPSRKLSSAAQPVEQPRVQSSRLQTSDIVNIAHAQVVAKQQALNFREKARLGAYAGDGERIWMTPITQPSPRAQAPNVPPMQMFKTNPKDLVTKMEKKEVEMMGRLESARRAQLVADDELAAKFKSFSAMQVSARKAIREGVY